MTLHREAINGQMTKIARIVSGTMDSDYYLAGGTALALQIGNRKSVDLDYFIAKDINTARLREEITQIFVGHSVEIAFEEKNTLWCKIDGVKISFISRFDALLEKSLHVDEFKLAGVRDITVMKLSTICGREEYKDYFDLACLTTITDARSWMAWWEKVYPHADATSWLVALAAIDQLTPIPLDLLPAYQNINAPRLLQGALTEITKQLG